MERRATRCDRKGSVVAMDVIRWDGGGSTSGVSRAAVTRRVTPFEFNFSPSSIDFLVRYADLKLI